MKNIRILILGTGGMANQHADAYKELANVEIVAGVDTNAQRLEQFKDKFNIAKGFSSLDEAIQWGEFDACSNVTPDRAHHSTTMKLLNAGKHVLCEKPLATNYQDAKEMAKTAHAKGLVNMVNLSYRERQAVAQAKEMVLSGKIGKIRHFEASYLQSWLLQSLWGDWQTDEQWQWKLSSAHGSGALGDLGIHIVDLATYVSGSDIVSVSCRLNNYEKTPGNKLGKYILDANDSFNMHVELTNGASGVIHASRAASGHVNDLKLKLYGTKGALEINTTHLESSLQMCHFENLQAPVWKAVEVNTVRRNYDKFISTIRGESLAISDFNTGEKLQKVLDAAMNSNNKNGLNIRIS